MVPAAETWSTSGSSGAAGDGISILIKGTTTPRLPSLLLGTQYGKHYYINLRDIFCMVDWKRGFLTARYLTLGSM